MACLEACKCKQRRKSVDVGPIAQMGGVGSGRLEKRMIVMIGTKSVCTKWIVAGLVNGIENMYRIRIAMVVVLVVRVVMVLVVVVVVVVEDNRRRYY